MEPANPVLLLDFIKKKYIVSNATLPVKHALMKAALIVLNVLKNTTSLKIKPAEIVL
jgi:hypothetical protein